jgi:hypothetical protein
VLEKFLIARSVLRWMLTLAVLATLWLPAGAAAQTSGTISGHVFDNDGLPLSGVMVVISEAGLSAITDELGSFTIRAVPTGTHTVRALKMGFETVERSLVAVEPGQTATLRFTLRPTSVGRTREIVVEGRRGFIQKESSTTRQTVRREDMESLPVDSIKEAIGLKAGVVLQAGELHFRGGRGNEVLYQIDGIPVRDPLGGRAVDVAASALSEAEALLGGLDAEYGNAQSGVVNISTREGGTRFSGEVTYSTDDYGAPDKTFDNLDRIEVGMGGPLIPQLTWFTSFQGTFQDTYLKTSERRPRRTVLDLIQVGPRQDNDYHFQGKLAATPGTNQKLTLELLSNQNRRDEYAHIWSRTGFVETRIDTVPQTGDIVVRYGKFSADPDDSTYIAYSAPEHTPDIHEGFEQIKAIWTHTLSPQTFYTLKLSRHAFSRLDQVQGKLPWEYDGLYPAQWRDEINLSTHLFFATNGDAPIYTDRRSKTWTVKADWTSGIGCHRL